MSGTGKDQGASAWQPIETAPDRVTVLTKIDDDGGERGIARLQRQGRLWFLLNPSTGKPSMYVYYTPTHWQPLPASSELVA